MKKNTLIILSILVLALAGCGGDKKDLDTGSSDGGGILSNLGGTKFYTDEDIEEIEACEILTMDMVLEYAPGVSESEVTAFDMFGCNYSWEKSNYEEIEARNDKLLMDNGFQNMMSLNLESTENEIALTYNDFFIPQTEEAIDNTFRSLTNRLTQQEEDTNSQVLKDAFDSIGSGDETDQQVSETAEDLGMGEAVQDKLEEGFNETEKELGNSFIDIATSTNDEDIYVDVEGIGDKAAWSEFSKNMVVQHNNFIFEVAVDIESNSRASAEEIAKELLSEIKSQL